MQNINKRLCNFSYVFLEQVSKESGMVAYKVVATAIANRRRDHRVASHPIELQLQGGTYVTANWSLGGFLVTDYVGPSGPGDLLAVHIVVRVGDVIYRHLAEAEVVRISPVKRKMASTFTRLEPDAMDTLEGVLTGRLRRQAVNS